MVQSTKYVFSRAVMALKRKMTMQAEKVWTTVNRISITMKYTQTLNQIQTPTTHPACVSYHLQMYRWLT